MDKFDEYIRTDLTNCPKIPSKYVASILPGALMYYATTSIPEGYLLCNGGALNKSIYVDLFNAIGYIYGGSGNTFYIPDMRGYFIRTYGGDSAGIGQSQLNMVGIHDHIVYIRNGDGGGSGTPAFDETNNPWGNIAFRTQQGNNMGNETRPNNKAFYLFIKY